MGHPMIMGRRTFDSIGRALPGRRTIVVTRDPDWSAPGVDGRALGRRGDRAGRCRRHCPASEAGDRLVMVVGGGEIYRQTIDRADRLEITQVDADVVGDTRFPEIDPALWQVTGQRGRRRLRVRQLSCAASRFATWACCCRRWSRGCTTGSSASAPFRPATAVPDGCHPVVTVAESEGTTLVLPVGRGRHGGSGRRFPLLVDHPDGDVGARGGRTDGGRCGRVAPGRHCLQRDRGISPRPPVRSGGRARQRDRRAATHSPTPGPESRPAFFGVSRPVRPASSSRTAPRSAATGRCWCPPSAPDRGRLEPPSPALTELVITPLLSAGTRSVRISAADRIEQVGQLQIEGITDRGEQLAGCFLATPLHLGEVSQRDIRRRRHVAQRSVLPVPSVAQCLSQCVTQEHVAPPPCLSMPGGRTRRCASIQCEAPIGDLPVGSCCRNSRIPTVTNNATVWPRQAVETTLTLMHNVDSATDVPGCGSTRGYESVAAMFASISIAAPTAADRIWFTGPPALVGSPLRTASCRCTRADHGAEPGTDRDCRPAGPGRRRR